MAVRDGRILRVGRSADLRALAGPDTTTMDLQGRAVTPGIVDAHLHILYFGRQFWPGYLDIRFPKARTVEDLLKLVGDRARALRKGE